MLDFSNIFLIYLIKLSGHSGSSTITTMHAFDPNVATAEPTKDKIPAKKLIQSLLLLLCLNYSFKPCFFMYVL